ncbi:pilus assembly protein PilZ [Peribacillus cavernae]|uniref:Pilus assembly protein PilZ n=1 Tax=Peribacillus cavernae TaxID=1674310 RepID=A0A433HLM4_9BACI|nr:flagellar brake domain-containing protein [Peribacillus cavernae]MDQ0219008.1 c-di-GMP-binding flagellar brake protein YcgR [Peribacillus cavernae]RUQ29286.1 pilus assembly protein PilZ [Peribacillus cavernae]
MIKIGDTLLIEPKFSLQSEQYKSMVVEISESSIFIDYPINTATGKIAFLLDGTQMKITFIAGNQDLYIFDTEVLGRVKAQIAMIQLSHPPIESYVKIQRRQFVRVETPVDTAVHPEAFEFEPFRAITDDISAGGAALRILKQISLQPHSNIFVWLALPLKSGEIGYLRLKSNVIRISEHTERFNKLSVQFIEMADANRQTLIRYIFERQVEMKKKGLID